jgi:hypothetical protein
VIAERRTVASAAVVLTEAFRRRANGAALRLVAAPQIFIRPNSYAKLASSEAVLNRRPAAPATSLIDAGMSELYALDLSDLPDADTTDSTDLASNCGCIGIDVERRDNRRALFRRNSIIAAACRDSSGKPDACLFGHFPDAPTLTSPISLATAVALELTLSAATTCRRFSSVNFFPGMAA